MQSTTPESRSPWQLKLQACGQLMRVEKPIGTYLVLWPTLWALWIAAEGIPDLDLLLIFCLGTFLMRSAGCVINDYADRKIDGHVKRTAQRPIPAGLISAKEALYLFSGLLILAFILVLFTNQMTVLMSFGAVALATCYPFMKRYTHLPQVVLGMAFAWAIPMAFTATLNSIPNQVWLLYIATVLWTVAYDTMYAMVDRDDDLKIGVKSTAVLFGDMDKVIIGILQLLTLSIFALLAVQLGLSLWFYMGILMMGGFFVYQQYLIRDRQRDACFKAFLNNHYAGMALFISLFLHYLTL
ncbi:4-hydroxybenzoate octaprenyltransferase [Amphritea balenae]|uniref:4-hydroxybenzoate octaprenyltransferase n=1 Tax=Amphritea balenae TaxID=452629 RepID=A0A3P1SP10_9GAMM|nr:4-hydroxybenzoate octaprenyltransferase [Amphritea balenae]RRC98800.1 4-hydroxybenzoate octaprenyltransferase [Amphritea balenae]GGK61800.1 4-hydroxybenzoate octaprenyltransferase [Amphritea balenae]